jgi:hypothetical protein
MGPHCSRESLIGNGVHQKISKLQIISIKAVSMVSSQKNLGKEGRYAKVLTSSCLVVRIDPLFLKPESHAR